MFHSEDLR